jgi:hypothetical protein
MRIARRLSVLVCAVSIAVAPAALPGRASAADAALGAPAPIATAQCAVADLSLREVEASPSDQPTEATYIVENHGAAACRMSGGLGVRLLDPQGNEIPLRFAPRTAMAMLLTLPVSGRASFTVSYASPPAGRCAQAARIAAYVPAQTTPLLAPSTIGACTGVPVRVSNLTLLPPARIRSLID